MEWFENWFNNKYYHILYKNRDNIEAKLFIDNLIDYLKPEKQHTFLDLGCGRGRHSIYLNSKGYNVTGIDLSPNNIKYAKQFENKNLRFFKHDMRTPIEGKKFDFILNLFTSFGYFNKNQTVIDAMKYNLKENGLLIIDFLNVKKALLNLVEHEEKKVENINFLIKRKIEKNTLIKDIFVNKKEHFQEKVKILTLSDFQSLLLKANFKIVDIFGNFKLSDFNSNKSDRLIIISRQ